MKPTSDISERDQKLLTRLEKQVKKEGRIKVAMALGYKSESTMNKWFASGRIPPLALDKVKAFLKGKR